MRPTRLSRAETDALRASAIEVLGANRRVGRSRWGDRRYDFVCPSPTHYPFQWFWDSCFHAIALTHVDVQRAAQELRGLAAAAQPDGFMPHMILWEKEAHAEVLARYNIWLGGDYWTATIQPPVLAQALRRVHEAGADRRLLDDLLPATIRLFDWLARERDPDGDGLIAILQPDESGMDACSKYDEPLRMPTLDEAGLSSAMRRLFEGYRPWRSSSRLMFERHLFNVEDVLVNSIYIRGLHDLAHLCRARGAEGPARRAEDRAARALDSLLARCWDPGRGAFWDLAGADERPLRTLTVSSLMPLIIPSLPREIASILVSRHLLNDAEFWLPYPVPSVSADEPSFDPAFETGLIWRGPTWVNTNWFLIDGLRRHGFTDEADELAGRTLAMVARGGFREFFNPHTAEGYGAYSFGWTTLILDLIPPPA